MDKFGDRATLHLGGVPMISDDMVTFVRNDLIVFGGGFAAENADKVHFSYFVGSMEQPLSFLLVLAVFVGGALGVMASLALVLQLKNQIRRLRKSEALARQEVQNLRTLPVKDKL